MFFFDTTMFLLIPAMLLALYAQNKVKSTYNKFARVHAGRGMSGAQVARMLLDRAGLNGVGVELSRGHLTDHYDPRKQVVRLSGEVYQGTSLAALGIAAHETGHALQHAGGYFALTLRNNFFPVASLGSSLAMPLFLVGFLFSQPGGDGLGILMDVGIMLFSFAVLFQVITLPVEFNASSRAIALLRENNVILSREESGVRAVLNAAALTYVAATAVAVSHLLRLILLRKRRQ
ncbi:MAG: zinc metallopeptidase [Firmicutes bacterium]|nr:zinc metallopeptidase [Bacillota bacterium]